VRVTGSAYWVLRTSPERAASAVRLPVLRKADLWSKNCDQYLRIMRAGIESALV
jgi:hypothetical protein